MTHQLHFSYDETRKLLLPPKDPEEDEEEKQEVTASLDATRLMSPPAPVKSLERCQSG